MQILHPFTGSVPKYEEKKRFPIRIVIGPTIARNVGLGSRCLAMGFTAARWWMQNLMAPGSRNSSALLPG